MSPKRVISISPTRFVTTFVIGFFLFIQSLSAADIADIDATSRTYFMVKEDSGGENYITAYEYVDVDLYNIKSWGLDIQSSGWLRQHLDTVPFQDEDNDRGESELTYAFLCYSPFKKYKKIGDFKFKLGRQFLFSGPINEHIDGISSNWDFKKFIGCSAYFGVPVDDENDEKRLTQIVGGRVYYRILGFSEIGVSYLKVKDNKKDNPYREELGVDIWAQPFDFVVLQGSSIYNDQTNDVKENDYTLTFTPIQTLSLCALYTHINYDDYFVPSFWDIVLSEIPEKEELGKYGGRVNYHLNDTLIATAEYIYYRYDIQGSANYYGGSITTDDLMGFSAGASVHRMDGDTERLKYTISRLYGGRKLWKLDIVIDASYLFLDESFIDKDDALSVSGNAAYRVNDSLKLSAMITYIEDPSVNHGAEAFFSMIYDF